MMDNGVFLDEGVPLICLLPARSFRLHAGSDFSLLLDEYNFTLIRAGKGVYECKTPIKSGAKRVRFHLNPRDGVVVSCVLA